MKRESKNISNNLPMSFSYKNPLNYTSLSEHNNDDNDDNND